MMKTRRLITVIAAAVLVLAIGAVAVTVMNQTVSFSGSDSAITMAGAAIDPIPVNAGAQFNVKLNKGSILAFGRETWQEGDEIIFRIRADSDMQLKVGIIPAENMDNGYGYNDYGLLLGKEVSVTQTVQEVTFTVPASGEYGIGASYVTKGQGPLQFLESIGTVDFVLEVNRAFENPLVE